MSAPLPCGLFNLPYTDWGKGPGGDTGTPRYGASVVVVSPSNISAVIDAADANNVLVFANFVDSRNNWTTPGSGSTRIFSRTLYQSQIERYSEANLGTTLYNKVVDALKRRRLIGYAGDEFYIAQFGNSIVPDDVDWMGQQHKIVFGADCLIAVRLSAVDLEGSKLPSTGSWQWIDYGWAQSEGTLHTPSNAQTAITFFSNQYSRMAAVNLGCVPGHNLFDGGDATCWDYLNTGSSSGHYAGTFTSGTVSPGQAVACGAESTNTRWYTRPAQLQTTFDALMDSACAALLAQAPAFVLWTDDPTGLYPANLTTVTNRADQVAALDYGINAVAARPTFTWRTPKGVPVSNPPSGARPLLKHVTSFNTGTGAAGTTVTVPHGLGATPKAIILMWSGRTESVNAAGLGSFQRGMGWSIGSIAGQNIATASAAAHNGAGGSGDVSCRSGTNGGCILMLGTNSTVAGKATVQSWDATNVVFSIVTQFTASLRVTMLALAGTAIENVACGISTTPNTGTAPFTTDFTPLSFTPRGDGRSLLLVSCPGETVNFSTGSIIDDGNLQIGVATSPTQRGVIYHGDDSAAATTAIRTYTYPGEVLSCARTAPGSLNYRADFAAWITNGFRLQTLAVTAQAQQFGWLVIDGPKFSVQQANTSVTGAATVSISGVGFRPEAGIALSARKAQSTQGSAGSGTGITYGLFDGTNQEAHSTEESNGVTTSVVRTGYRKDNVYVGVNGSGTVTALMGLQSLDSDGATFVMNDGDDQASQFHAVLMAGITGVQINLGLSLIVSGGGAVAAAQLGGGLDS